MRGWGNNRSVNPEPARLTIGNTLVLYERFG